MRFLFKRYGLLASVFITGAAVLIVEVTATRILSPYFGNTIYTVSSVIGVVLTALSLGYYIGGIVSDKYPSQKLFFAIIIVSGLAILFIRILIYFLLPFLANSFSIISGPLVSSLLLFFPPSFLLGTLSPYAIKLKQVNAPKVGVGKVAGEVFFWSTFGSIVGSLAAGFLLIPHFGLDKIIVSVGSILIVFGITGFTKTDKGGKREFLIVIILLVGLFSLVQFLVEKENILYSKDGVYEKIQIYDAVFAGRPARFFQQDRSASGAMFLDSDKLVYDYTKYYVLHKLFNPSPKQALVLGGGAYSVPKAILKNLPGVSVDVVEIESSLHDLAQKYFRLPTNSRLKNYTADGRSFVRDSRKTYDLIFSDVYYSFFSVPVHFTTQEFFSLAKEKLSGDGVFIANFIGDLETSGPSLMFSLIRTFRLVFPNSYFFALDSSDSKEAQNIIFLGVNGNKKINFSDLESKTKKEEIMSNLARKRVDFSEIDLGSYPILTDNYAPIEYLTAQVLKRSLERKAVVFDTERAMNYVKQQLSFGPRYLNAQGHKNTQDFLTSELKKLSNDVITQKWDHYSTDGKKNTLMNIMGRFNRQEKNRILLGTHYDTKRFADKDEEFPKNPVPGANDGASGVGLLFEIAQFLSNTDTPPRVGVDMVFFDGEEGEEDLAMADWQPLGSQHFAKEIDTIYPQEKPLVGIVADMICDKDLNIFIEENSLDYANMQVKDFWQMAVSNWPSHFFPKAKYRIFDDHIALNTAGIPSFLIIDFEYPYFHTTQDTIDKCSENSLKVVGESVIGYIYSL